MSRLSTPRVALLGAARRLVLEVSSRLLEENGRPAGVQAISRDVTERRRAERALQARTEQLELIAATVTSFLRSGDWREATALLLSGALRQTESEYGFAGVVVEGPTLRILAHEGTVWDRTVNREFYEGAVRTYREVGHLEFTNCDNLFGLVITGGQAVVSNDAPRDPRAGGIPPGHPPLRSFLGVPFLSGGEVVGMIGVANRPGGYTEHDRARLELLAQMAAVLYESYRRLERQEALEEQLRQAQKMEAIGQLAGGVAHDFNNLLTAIRGYSDILLQEMDGQDPRRGHVAEIQAAADRASSLTRQLLAFGRRQALQPRLLDLNAVVLGMSPMLGRLLGADVELAVELEPELAAIQADPTQVEQVLLNLAVNARDAMPDGGKLTVETANVELEETYARWHVPLQPGSYVLLAASDTGSGMDEETRARVFEPFFTTKDEGTGLGLATVYGIVKQSGGYIWAYSEPGRGTTFKVYLPQVSGAPEVAQPDQLVRPSGSETVLVVEDEQPVRKLVRHILAERGYTVVTAADGAGALELASGHAGQIDLLVIDMVMPGLSGSELAKELLARCNGARVLYMSGYSHELVAERAGLGTDAAFVQKPFAADQLAREVRKALDRSRQ